MSSADQVKATIELINNSNLDPKIVKREGAGKAYQSVAQSMALAVQDAVDYQRNLMAIAQAAIAVSTEGMIAAAAEDNIPKVGTYSSIIINVQTDIVGKAIENFSQIGMKAGEVLSNFPSGD
jgi:hypothetical protein